MKIVNANCKFIVGFIKKIKIKMETESLYVKLFFSIHNTKILPVKLKWITMNLYDNVLK